MRRQGITRLPGFLQTGEVAEASKENDLSLGPETSCEGAETGQPSFMMWRHSSAANPDEHQSHHLCTLRGGP